MTPPIRPLPKDADQFRAIQWYKKTCEAALKKKGERELQSPQPFQLSKARLFNRYPGDGRYQILYTDQDENFFCSAEVDLKSHEMEIRTGRLTPKVKQAPAGLQVMKETCALTEYLAPEETALQQCRESAVDPALIRNQYFSPPQYFQDYCWQRLIRQKGKIVPHNGDLGFSLERTEVINPGKHVPSYTLQYISRGQNFFCQGDIDLLGKTISLKSGTYRDIKEEKAALIPYEDGFFLEDACQFTSQLFGEEKNLGNCTDKSAKEIKQEYVTDLAFRGAMTYAGLKGVRAIFGWGYRHSPLPRLINKIPRPKFLSIGPKIKFNSGIAYLSGLVFDEVSGLFLSPENPVRKYGPYVAAGIGGIAPSILRHSVKFSPGSLWLARGRLLSGIGRGFLAVAVLDLGVQYLVVGDEYDAWLNERTTNVIYNEHVYELDGWDILLVPLLIKALRSTCREIAPNAMEWGVANDHPEIKERIFAEDFNNSIQFKKDMAKVLPQLLNASQFFDIADEASYQTLDLSPFRKMISEEDYNAAWNIYTTFSGLLNNNPENPAVTQWKKLAEEAAQTIHLFDFQERARFMFAVTQPVNNWVRRIFNPDGTVQPEQEEALLHELINPDSGMRNLKEEIIIGRRTTIALEYLRGAANRKFLGEYVVKLAKKARIITEDGRWIISEPLKRALTLFISDVYKKGDIEGENKILSLRKTFETLLAIAKPGKREEIKEFLKIFPDVDLEERGAWYESLGNSYKSDKICYRKNN